MGRRLLGSLVVSVVLGGVALAQPGAPQPYAPPPQPYPPPQPQPYAPAPSGYQPVVQVQLTADEAEILRRGPISDGAHIGGGVASLFVGFGVGQALQGRWGDTGWIFTVGELASMGLMIYGFAQVFEECYGEPCNGSDGVAALLVGALAAGGFRIWEVVDAFAGPASYNRRYKDLQLRVQGYAPPRWGIYSARSMDRQATVTGLELRF